MMQRRLSGAEYRNRVFIYPLVFFLIGFILALIVFFAISSNQSPSLECVSETECIYTDESGNRYQFDPTASANDV